MKIDIQFIDLITPRHLLPPMVGRRVTRAATGLCLVGLSLFTCLPLSAQTATGTSAAKKHPAQHAARTAAHPATQAAVQKPMQPAVVPVVQAAVAPSDSASKIAPLANAQDAVSNHAPFEAGDCSICHEKNDTQNPGKVTVKGNELCLSCHDNFGQLLARKFAHPAAQQSCLNCHNPHDSKQQHLLLESTETLCLGCHEPIKKVALDSKVPHDALSQGKQCANCHNPHGSDVEHLLVQLPMQLCLGCHGKDGVVDHNGKQLINMNKLLEENPHQHGPVAAQDCSSCHMPHGSENFRLLTNEYPAKFYSAYDSKNYSLCFGCHDEKAFTTPQTEELTQFRNGSKNLHYVHVNRDIMGRTCRACHDVHAAPQEHQIRASVPYGPNGWALKLNYTQTATGGSCAKTCHQTRSYNNTKATAATATPEQETKAK